MRALPGAFPNPTLAERLGDDIQLRAGAEAHHRLRMPTRSAEPFPHRGYQTADRHRCTCPDKVRDHRLTVWRHQRSSLHTSGEYISTAASASLAIDPVTQSTRDNSCVGGVSTAPCGTTTESYPDCGGDPTTDVFVGTGLSRYRRKRTWRVHSRAVEERKSRRRAGSIGPPWFPLAYTVPVAIPSRVFLSPTPTSPSTASTRTESPSRSLPSSNASARRSVSCF